MLHGDNIASSSVCMQVLLACGHQAKGIPALQRSIYGLPLQRPADAIPVDLGVSSSTRSRPPEFSKYCTLALALVAQPIHGMLTLATGSQKKH